MTGRQAKVDWSWGDTGPEASFILLLLLRRYVDSGGFRWRGMSMNGKFRGRSVICLCVTTVSEVCV